MRLPSDDRAREHEEGVGKRLQGERARPRGLYDDAGPPARSATADEAVVEWLEGMAWLALDGGHAVLQVAAAFPDRRP